MEIIEQKKLKKKQVKVVKKTWNKLTKKQNIMQKLVVLYLEGILVISNIKTAKKVAKAIQKGKGVPNVVVKVTEVADLTVFSIVPYVDADIIDIVHILDKPFVKCGT